MSGRARSTSAFTTLVITFCPATTSTRNTSIARTDGRRSSSSADGDGDHDDDHRAPELRDRAQDRRGEVGRVRRAPRREAVVDARESGVLAHHPEQHADRDRAGDDDSGRDRQQQTRRELRIDACAHERAQLRMRFDFVADDRARGARRRGICGRPAPDGRGDEPRRRPARRPARTRTTTYERFANRSIGETRTHANPVDGRGRRGGGFAANPGRSRLGHSDARAARSLRSRPPGGAAEQLAGHLERRHPVDGGGDRDRRGLRRAHRRDGRARPVPDEDRLRRVFGLGCRGQSLVRRTGAPRPGTTSRATARRSPTRSP